MFLPPADRTIQDILARLNDLENWRVRHAPHTVGGNVTLTEGTFTPAWVGTTGAGVFTYNNQTGFYTTLNNIRMFWGRVRLGSITTPPTGDMYIETGMPLPATFPDASTVVYPGGYAFQRVSNVDFLPATTQLTLSALDVGGLLALFPEEVSDNGTFSLIPAAGFTNTVADVIFSGFYREEA